MYSWQDKLNLQQNHYVVFYRWSQVIRCISGSVQYVHLPRQDQSSTKPLWSGVLLWVPSGEVQVLQTKFNHQQTAKPGGGELNAIIQSNQCNSSSPSLTEGQSEWVILPLHNDVLHWFDVKIVMKITLFHCFWNKFKIQPFYGSVWGRPFFTQP